MSWAKRNLYFLISCVVAVALLGAAGWYCFSEWQGSSASSDLLNQAIDQLNNLGGNNKVTPTAENIEAAKAQAKQAQELADRLRKHLVQIPSIPKTNNVDDRDFAFAVRDTLRQLSAAAEANHVTLPPDFAFTFAAQRDKVKYADQARDQLARELGEVKVICGVLFSNRVDSIEVLQRERTADDVAGTMSGNDYLDAISVTNNDTIITPYQVTFSCFDPALSGVIAGFANQPYGIMVRTLEVGPEATTPGEPGMAPPAGMLPGGGVLPEGRFQPNVTPAPTSLGSRGGLPVVVDEQRLRVTMLLQLVRIVPTPGR